VEEGDPELRNVLRGVFKLLPIVRCASEDIVCATQLLQVCQPLELWSVYDLHSYRVQPKVAMHRIIEQLQSTRNPRRAGCNSLRLGKYILWNVTKRVKKC